MADLDGDGVDDLTGEPVNDAQTELPGVSLLDILAAGNKVYYEPTPIGYGGGKGSAGFKKITFREAIGQFTNIAPDKIKALQTEFKKVPGYQNIKATGRLDTQEQVNLYVDFLDKAWSSYSKLVELNPLTPVRNIGQFIDNTVADSTGRSSTKIYETLYLTSKADAIQFFNQLHTELTGQAAAPGKAEEFYKNLNNIEKQTVQTQAVTQTATGSRTVMTKASVDELDKEQLALDIITKELGDSKLFEAGGQLGLNYKDIKSLLSDFNVVVDEKTKREYLLSSIKSKNGLKDVANRITKLSALQNPGLAPYIEAGYKPTEVFAGYQSLKQQFYGQPNLSPNPWDDQDIRWLASQPKLPGYQQWQDYLGTRPGAEYTPGFRQKAADFVTKVGQELGFM